MSAPKSVVKMKKTKGSDGYELQFTSSVDRVNYTLRELIQGANKDVGKFLAVEMNAKARSLFRGVNKYSRGRIGTLYKVAAFQFWARKKEGDLLVGIKHDTWYGAKQELGEGGMPKHGVMYETVKENVDKIREIRKKAESTIFKGDDLCINSLLREKGIDFGEYAMGRKLKKELIQLEHAQQ